MRRSLLEKIGFDRVRADGYAFQIEMKYRVHRKGLSITEIPIVFPDRVAGESKMDSSIAREAIWQVWKLRFTVGRER